MTEDHAVVRAMTRLNRVSGPNVSVQQWAGALCLAAADALDLAGAGVTLLQDGRMQYCHAWPGNISAVERAHQTAGRGPGQDSLVRREAVAVDDIRSPGERPELVDVATRNGIAALAAVPLHAWGRAWGVLHLYRGSAGAWTAGDLTIAGLLADLVAAQIAIASEHDSACAWSGENLLDPVTCLPGSAILEDRVHGAVARAVRRNGSAAVLHLLADGFADLEHTLGEAAFDVVLRAVTDRLRQELRVGDTLARTARYSFVVLAEDLDGPPAAIQAHVRALAGRLQGATRRQPTLGEADVVVPLSIGAVIATHPHTACDLLADAERAAARASRRGGDHLVIRTAGSLMLAQDTHTGSKPHGQVLFFPETVGDEVAP